MGTDKEALLAAVAQAGEQGRKDYEAAQAANQAAQAQAIQAALMGAAQNVNAGGAAQLQRIVSQPYQTSAIHLNENQAASGDWFNRLGASANQWGTVMGGLNEAVTARALAEAAAGGSGGGGSGGGGGGSDSIDWYSGLKDAFGTAAIAKNAIKAEADSSNDWHQTGMSNYEAAIRLAADKYSVPENVAQSWYSEPKYANAIRTSKKLAQTPNTKKGLQEFVKRLRKGAAQFHGQNTGYYNAQAIAQKRAQVQAAAAKRRRQQAKKHH